MSSTPANDRGPLQRHWRRPAIEFGAWGLLSGCVVVGLITLAAFPETALEFLDHRYALWFGDVSLIPGLVFGLFVGGALMRRRLAGFPGSTVFCLASVAANFAATNLAMNIVEMLDSMVATGAIAGLFGAACLAGASAALLPFLRRWPSCLGAVAAGGALGGLLAAVDAGARGADWLFLYPPWQAGFAAALFAVAPPRRG
jgi:hypothetical protein